MDIFGLKKKSKKYRWKTQFTKANSGFIFRRGIFLYLMKYYYFKFDIFIVSLDFIKKGIKYVLTFRNAHFYTPNDTAI